MRQPRPVLPGGKGFTLVEVLVVIVLVAIAAGVVQFSPGISTTGVLEDEADRLRHSLETGLDRSRVAAGDVIWTADPGNYRVQRIFESDSTVVTHRLLPRSVKIAAVTVEGVPLVAPFQMKLSGRRPELFRIRLEAESGANVELRSNPIGRVERFSRGPLE